MRRTSTWLVALWIGICSAAGQETTSADDIRTGHRVAIIVCAFCHVAAPDQARIPILNPPAPSFESIAQRTSISAEWLENCGTQRARGNCLIYARSNPRQGFIATAVATPGEKISVVIRFARS